MSINMRCRALAAASAMLLSGAAIAQVPGVAPSSGGWAIVWFIYYRDTPAEHPRANAAEQFGIYGRLPSYRAMLDREGYLGPQDAAIIGDEKTVTERLDDLRGAGVDEFVGLPFGRSQEDRARTRALLRTYASATDER